MPPERVDKTTQLNSDTSVFGRCSFWVLWRDEVGMLGNAR